MIQIPPDDLTHEERLEGVTIRIRRLIDALHDDDPREALRIARTLERDIELLSDGR